MLIRRQLKITGTVQGVGFRPFVHRLAQQHGLSGWVVNKGDGVEVEAEGEPDRLESFVRDLRQECPPLARIAGVSIRSCALCGGRGFAILASQVSTARTAAVPPDVALCAECERELLDPANRRFRYPFINCTQCGPRFTIVEEVPYDRPNTTMRAFGLCERCAAEYRNVEDRRFHAEPIACPVCGPQVCWRGPDGEKARGEGAMQRAAALLAAGGILALKGLGGFHIACDAANAEAVRCLRTRKDRPAKPFALMSRSPADVERYAFLLNGERRLLESPQRPIVLARKRPDAPLAQEVAPHVPDFGVMLAYTPLHVLLFESGVRFLALVMTSGNRRDEPIARTNAEAEERLNGIADGFLFHNREIHNRADDSIVRALRLEAPTKADGGGCGNEPQSVQVIRRARGFVPEAVAVDAERSIFAAGAELKSTFCLVRSGEAVLSPYLGDLDDERTLAFYTEMFQKYARLLDFSPEAVACDLHPDYLSTRFAEEFACRNGLPLLRVQHHEAHVASVLAEHRWRGPGSVLGVAFDGTGLGADGAIWGGDFFVFEPSGARRRVAQLEYFPLPGGDAAAREVWRAGAGLLSKCGMAGRVLGSLARIPDEQRAAVQRMIEMQANCPRTSSMGRLFDAAAVLAGLGPLAGYEAEAAMNLEAACGADFAPYSCVLTAGWPAQVLLEPLVRELAADAGQPPRLAARFHATVAEMILAVAERASREEGIRAVALSGGVFQNRILAELAHRKLCGRGFAVLLNNLVPPNDGGLSLGQAWLADR